MDYEQKLKFKRLSDELVYNRFESTYSPWDWYIKAADALENENDAFLAIGYINKALSSITNETKFFNLRAKAYLRLKMFKESILDLKRAMILDSESICIKKNLLAVENLSREAA